MEEPELPLAAGAGGSGRGLQTNGAEIDRGLAIAGAGRGLATAATGRGQETGRGPATDGTTTENNGQPDQIPEGCPLELRLGANLSKTAGTPLAELGTTGP